MSTFLTAEWRKLAMLNYEVPPEVLQPYLPAGTELDTFRGRHFVSLVGFRFINTKLKGIAVPFHRHFEEVNLRFYVRYKEGGVWRRGVTFISEIVPRWALSFVANTVYKEKYSTKPMRYSWQQTEAQITVQYGWKHLHKWNHLELTAENRLQPLRPGSKEQFITEHYWGYSKGRNKTTEYSVEHPSWQIYPVLSYQTDVAFDAVYGSQFSFLNNARPASVLLAEGSAIKVKSKRIIQQSFY